MKKRLLYTFFFLLFLAILVVLLAYPNPLLFFQTMARFIWLPISAEEVAEVSATLPDDPHLIEDWVQNSIVYDSDSYEAWGVFAYIATPSETLLRGRGPCRATAILLASILEEKGIQYRLYAHVHAWVDYEGRHSTWELEQPQTALMYWENGKWHFNGFGWFAVAPEQLSYFVQETWQAFPPLARIMLLVSFSAGILLFSNFWRKYRQRRLEKSD